MNDVNYFKNNLTRPLKKKVEEILSAVNYPVHIIINKVTPIGSYSKNDNQGEEIQHN